MVRGIYNYPVTLRVTPLRQAKGIKLFTTLGWFTEFPSDESLAGFDGGGTWRIDIATIYHRAGIIRGNIRDIVSAEKLLHPVQEKKINISTN